MTKVKAKKALKTLNKSKVAAWFDYKTVPALALLLVVLGTFWLIKLRAAAPYTGLYHEPLPMALYEADETKWSHSNLSTAIAALDIGAPIGTPIYAVVGGSVSTNCDDAAFGKHICLTGNDGLKYLYAHLNSFGVTSGTVGAGRQIGTTGDTGNSFGPHLHFEIRCNSGSTVPNGCSSGQRYPHTSQCNSSGWAVGPYKFLESFRDIDEDGKRVSRKLNLTAVQIPGATSALVLPQPERRPIRRVYGANYAPWAKYGGCQSAPSTVSNPNPEDTTKPANATNVRKGSGTNQSAIHVLWNTVSDASGYVILMQGSYIDTRFSADITVSNLDCGSSYTFAIIAYDGYGNTSSTVKNLSTTACPHGGVQVNPDTLPELPEVYF